MKSLNNYLYKGFLNNPRFLFLFFLLAIELYLFPLYYYGEKAYVQIYDNLDIAIPVLKVLANSGMLFAPSDAIVPNIMGGLPRLSYGPELNVYVWLHYFFDPFTAFVINETLMHLVAFVSMIVLLKRYYVPAHHRYRVLIIFSIALMFALLPFNPGAGLSVPSVPLALYAFLNIRHGRSTWKEWLIIVLIPLYSSLFLVYFFFLLVMSGMFAIDCLKNKKINALFLLALALMSAAFVVVEYRMFYDTFVRHLFVSHRTEFASVQVNGLWEVYRSAHQAFLNGSVDMDTRASGVLIPFMLLAIGLSVIKRRLSWQLSLIVIFAFLLWLAFPQYMEAVTGNKWAMPTLVIATVLLYAFKKRHRLFYGAIGLQLFFSYWYALWFYEGTGELAQIIPILKEFNFARVVLLQPVVWAVITALGMAIVARKLRFALLLLIGALLFQLHLLFNVREFSAPRSEASYRSYYAENLFTKLKAYIGKDPSSYRVGCLAFEPAIAIYNGMYTIDGYMTHYPLEYKHRFHKVIERALWDDKGSSALFLGWGSKCYLFDGGESQIYYRKNATIKQLDLDMKALHELGGDYLLSSHPIERHERYGLVFMKKFTDPETFWKIYLYRVERPEE